MKKVYANWTYTPTDYFENEILLEEAGYSIKIKEGNIELVVNEEENENVSETHSKYSDMVESFFMAELLGERRFYELKVSSLKAENEDGSITKYIKPKSINVTFSFGTSVAFTIMDKDGNIIKDSEEEKQKKQIELLKKLQNALNRDEIVKGLIDSYKSSISDPNNELVHLYEIRDALHSYFGSHGKAIKDLSITAKEWNDLGRVCNGLPLNQGRHRGQNLGHLRDASKEELEKARTIAIKMIESFIDYLNKEDE